MQKRINARGSGMDQKKTLWRDPIGERHPGQVGSAAPQVLRGGGTMGAQGIGRRGRRSSVLKKIHEKIPQNS